MNIFKQLTTINLECGPRHDRRTFKLRLDLFRRRIGILVSGGMDSALLYYILLKLNAESGFTHKITPYTILRKEGSPVHAPLVINYIHDLFNLPKQNLNIVGDNTLSEEDQVSSGAKDIYDNHGCNILYVGVIENLEIHTVGWRPPIKWQDGDIMRYPLAKFNKSHIVDLIFQLGQEKLFELSHSCIYQEGRCGACNGCNERAWGFSQMGLIDPGSK